MIDIERKELFDMGKRGLVLGGGGAKGAYELGVWQVLREFGVSYSIITGTSIGALNGALMVQNDYEMALDLWNDISMEKIMKVHTEISTKEPFIERQKKMIQFLMKDIIARGGVDISPLEQILFSHLDEQRILHSPIEFGLVTVQYPSLRPVEICKHKIPQGLLGDYLLASAACFPAFKMKDIEGKRFIDGGYHDNVPIRLAKRLGAQEIIAVDLNATGVRKYFGNQEKITYIQSYWPLGGLLIFDNTVAQRNIRLGYNDAMKALGFYEGYVYTFHPDSTVEDIVGELEYWFTPIQLRDKGSLVERKLTKFFMERCVFTRSNKPSDIKNMCMMELCGEIFRLDPTIVYEQDEFKQCLIDEFLLLQKEDNVEVEDTMGNAKSASSKIAKLMDIDRRKITKIIYEKIKWCMDNQRYDRDLVILATGFFKEYIAAVYLHCLRA